MTKRELIERIAKLNPSARPDFLAAFSEDDLLAYLHQLQELAVERQERQTSALALAG
jgi:hypothetical protein